MQKKSINILLVMSFLAVLCSMNGCKHLSFDEPLTWRMSLSGSHDMVGKKAPNSSSYNIERVNLGVALEPDMTKIRIREEEKSYYRRRLWEMQQQAQLQKIATPEKPINLNKNPYKIR
jgi:hypothetical protein